MHEEQPKPPRFTKKNVWRTGSGLYVTIPQRMKELTHGDAITVVYIYKGFTLLTDQQIVHTAGKKAVTIPKVFCESAGIYSGDQLDEVLVYSRTLTEYEKTVVRAK